MKRKIVITLALFIGCFGVAYADYEPVRTMLDPALHSINLTADALSKNNHGAVDSAVEQAASKSTDGSLEQEDTHVKSAASAVHKTQPLHQSIAPQPNPQPKPVAKPTSKPTPPPHPAQSNLSTSVNLNVPAKLQGPELYNGCEVTSLSMLLSAAGHPVDKMTLADQITKDRTPASYDGNDNITTWGDPNRGFVGDVSGGNPGYGVYHGPIAQLLKSILSDRAEDISGGSFNQVLSCVASGHPVVAWTTATFIPTTSWTTWQGPNGPVKATFDEHVVLIVGYNKSQILLNDPLDGTASKAVDRTQFIAAWQQLGNQAVTYKG